MNEAVDIKGVECFQITTVVFIKHEDKRSVVVTTSGAATTFPVFTVNLNI
jgi:hypothetical protein